MNAAQWDVLLRPTPTLTGVFWLPTLAIAYAWIWITARARSGRSRFLELALFVLVGLVPLAVATLSGLVELRRFSMQAGAWQAGLLVAVAPMGIALGRPVTLLQEAAGDDGARWLQGVLRSAPLRALTFPLVTPLLDSALVPALFLTPWYQATVSSAVVGEATALILIGAGLLFVLPLVGEGADELMPRWCTPGVRAALSFFDGLVDAVAGIVVMTCGKPLWTPVAPTPLPSLLWDQQMAGAVLLGVFEAIGLPVILASVIVWMRADAAEARARDEAEDALLARPHNRREHTELVDVAERAEPGWLTDPRPADRYRPRHP